MDEMPMFEESTNKTCRKISIIGKPGAGKTTQAVIMSSTLGMLHISSGDLVRKYLTDSETISELSMGRMAPNEEAVRDLVRSAIVNVDNYVLDGFPRMIGQIDGLNIEINAIVNLSVPDEVIIERLLKRGRPDDSTMIIESRLKAYYELTHPLIDYFESKRIPIVTIDGSPQRSQVWANIVTALDELAK